MTATATDYLRAVEAGQDGLAAFYGEQLDELAAADDGWCERPEALLLSALHYVTRYRLRVFPLTPGSKVPLSKRLTCCYGTHRRGGFLDARDSVDAVRCWWAEHPRANVGIATGHRVDVVDQDGPAGAVSWLRGEAWPPVIGMVLTPREGGVHRYVEARGNGSGTRLAPGLDYRGTGGYVVAPPSVVDGRRYSWVTPLVLEPRARQ